MIEVLRLLTYHYSFGDFPESILYSRWERFIGQNLIYSRKGRQYIQQSDQVLREKKKFHKIFKFRWKTVSNALGIKEEKSVIIAKLNP